MIIAMLLPLATFAQVRNSVFLETGATHNIPFEKTTHIKDDGNGEAFYEWNISYNSTRGKFVRFGMDPSILRTKNISVSLPVSLAYASRQSHIVAEGSESGCFIWFQGKRETSTMTQVAGVSAGTKISFFEGSRLSFFTGFTIYADLRVREDVHIAEITERGRNDYFRTYRLRPGVSLNLSSDNGIMYRVDDHLSLGLVTNVQFVNVNGLPNRYARENLSLFNLGFGERSVIVHSGLRAEYRF